MSAKIETQPKAISTKATTADKITTTADKFKDLTLDVNTESTLRSGKITTAADFEKVNKLATYLYKLMES